MEQCIKRGCAESYGGGFCMPLAPWRLRSLANCVMASQGFRVTTGFCTVTATGKTVLQNPELYPQTTMPSQYNSSWLRAGSERMVSWMEDQDELLPTGEEK